MEMVAVVAGRSISCIGDEKGRAHIKANTTKPFRNKEHVGLFMIVSLRDVGREGSPYRTPNFYYAPAVAHCSAQNAGSLPKRTLYVSGGTYSGA